MHRFFYFILMVAFFSCDSGEPIQQYNDTVVGTYNYFMKAVGSHLSVIGHSAEETDSAVAILQPLTDSCLQVMRQTKPLKESGDFHKKVTAVYESVKTELLPAAAALGKLQAVEDSTAIKNPEMHQSLIQDFTKANEHLKILKEQANEAHRQYAKNLGIKIGA